MPAFRALAQFFAACAVILTQTAAEPLYFEEHLFEAESGHGHVHASSLVECPNGDLRAVWYENGTPLPTPPYYNERRDKSSDVRIGGGRKAKGADKWDAPFVMNDTFGVSDNNPTLIIDRDQRLWLIHSTMLGAPEWTWGSSLLQYKVSSDYQQPGVPKWEKSNLIVPHPQGFDEILDRLEASAQPSGAFPGLSRERTQEVLRIARAYLKDSTKLRLGWMPRTHPIIRSDGALVLPLSNENFNIAAMAITTDGGETWSLSNPVPTPGVIQPSLVELGDGTIQAYFRNGDPRRRILRGVSKDGGMTWSDLEATDRLHPGGGLEAIKLANGHLAIVYNNKEEAPRDKLAVSISTDDGRTWQWTREIENAPGGRFDYPSMIQSADGTLHVTYSYHLKTIKHVQFNEEWVQAENAAR